MHITWHGAYTIKIQAGETTLVIDPYSPATGLAPFRAKADIVALTNPTDLTMSHVSAIQGEPRVINHPGEYALDGFTLHALGWSAEDGAERSIQRWEVEDMMLLHVGKLNRDLTDKELQELEKTNIDVLIVPVGGGDSFSAKQAISFVMTIEPRIVIPINYKVAGIKGSLESVEQFAKEMGVDPKQAEKKLTIKAKQIPQDELVTHILMV